MRHFTRAGQSSTTAQTRLPKGSSIAREFRSVALATLALEFALGIQRGVYPNFVAEVLWPGQIVDARQREFTLQPQPPVANDALFERAMETRRTALDADGNAERPDVEP